MCGGAAIHNPPCRLKVQGIKKFEKTKKNEKIDKRETLEIFGNIEELEKIEKFERLTDDDFQEGSFFGTRQKRNNAEKKEKSRDAARERRAKESDYFQELEELLPMSVAAPSTSVSTSVDKTSLIRLTLAHLKTRNFIELGLPKTTVKEEVNPEVDQVDFLNCVNGFSLVLGAFGDLMYVSNNVHKFIGLTSTELTGQVLADYVHPCDHRQLDLLTPSMEGKTGEQRVEVFLRMKCTVTERGRIINLKQATYKTLKVSGKAIAMPCPEEGAGGLVGTVFMGLASLIVPQAGTPSQIGVFSTKHDQDMKFMEVDSWFCTVAGYQNPQILGQSFFNFVHTGDIANIQTSFRNLREQGQCETPAYRLLVRGGGWVWVKTAASLTSARRGGSKAQTISCQHHQITEVQDREKILALVQMETGTGNGHNGKTQKPNTSIKAASESNVVFPRIKGEKQEMDNSKNIIDFLSFEPLELMEEILSEKGIKIKPKRKENNGHYESKMGATSQPTSVIVNSRILDMPKAVTQSLFKKIDSRPDMDVNGAKTSPNTKKPEGYALKAVPSSLFCKPQKVAAMEMYSNEIMPSKEFGISTVEDDIFNSLLAFDNVEDLNTLAPHGGDDYVTIKSLLEPDVVEIDDVKKTYSNKGIMADSMHHGKNSTSVIVNPKPLEGPKAVTQSIFKKMYSRPMTDVINAKTSPHTEKTKDYSPKAVTSSFFCKPKKAAAMEKNSKKNIPSKDIHVSTVEDEIFASLLAFVNVEDLETLAPHGGDDFIKIKSLSEPEEIEIEDQTQHYLDEGMESNLMPQGKDSIYESFEEETNERVLINPGADTMWGGPRTSSPNISFSSPHHYHGGLHLMPDKLRTQTSSTITSDQWTGYVDIVCPKYPGSLPGPSLEITSLANVNPQTGPLSLEEQLDFHMGDFENKYPHLSLKKQQDLVRYQ